MSIGERIKAEREQRGWTQAFLAEKLNIKIGTLSGYERDYRQPDIAMVDMIAQQFEVSTDYLLGRTDDPRTIDQINKENAQRISDALASDPESEELLAFWNELKEREDLFLLFKQVRPLSDDSIRRVMRIIKAIEDEESGQSY